MDMAAPIHTLFPEILCSGNSKACSFTAKLCKKNLQPCISSLSLIWLMLYKNLYKNSHAGKNMWPRKPAMEKSEIKHGIKGRYHIVKLWWWWIAFKVSFANYFRWVCDMKHWTNHSKSTMLRRNQSFSLIIKPLPAKGG